MVQKIRGAEVVIGGDSHEAERAIDKLSGSVGRLGGMAKATIAAFAAQKLISFFSGILTEAPKAIDQMSKMARQTDGTTLGIQSLKRAAELSGVSFEGLMVASKQLNVSIGELVNNGTGPAVLALKKLGLTAKDLSKLDVDEKFGVIGDRMRELNLSAAEQGVLMRDLRIEDARLMNLMENGSETFKHAREEIVAFGAALSDVDARKVEQANDAMTSFGVAAEGVQNQLAVALAPVLQGISTEFAEMSKGPSTLGKKFERMVDSIVIGIGAVLDVFAVMKVVWNSVVSLVTKSVEYFKSAFQAIREYGMKMLDPLNLYSKALSYLIGEGESVAAELGEGFKKGVTNVMEVLRKEMGGEFPSEGLQKWLAASRKASQDAAQAAVDANNKRKEDSKNTNRVLSQAELQKAAEKQKKTEEEFQRLTETLATQEELENAQYARRLEKLREFLEMGKLTKEEFQQYEERLTQGHYEKLNQIQAASFEKSQQLYTGMANRIGGLLGDISNAIGTEGKKQFAITKAISLAQALIKGYESVVSSYAAGAKIGGPPLGAAYAAIAAAATAAQIASLRSTNASSSGGGGSTGNTSASAASVAAPQGTSQSLVVEGLSNNQLLTGSFVKDLAGQLLEFQKDGGTVVLA